MTEPSPSLPDNVRQRIRFVLVHTSHPGNIGAAARSMKTMGLRRLYLVDPLHYPSAEATARASGADDLLGSARVTETLAEAIADCALVLGTSTRSRRLTWPHLELRGAAERAVGECGAGEVAIVFGGEHSGLSNAELDHCHYVVSIPTDSGYRSLNLGAAVQVVAYEVLMAAREPVLSEQAGDGDALPTVHELELFYAHLERTLVEIGFLDPQNPRHLMRRLRRLFGRARLDRVELNILRGMLTAAQAHAGAPELLRPTDKSAKLD